jgi:hypothetical protein
MKGKTPPPRKPPRPDTAALDAAVMATLGVGAPVRRPQPAGVNPALLWPPTPPARPFVPPAPEPVAAPAPVVAPPAPVVAPPPRLAVAERDGRPRRRLLGEILLDEGRITRAQLDGALQAQAASPGTPLGQLLVEHGALTQQELGAVLDRYNRKYRLGDLLVETNALTEAQLETALAQQRATGLRLGDVLLELGYVNERDLRQALAKQLRVRFAELDELRLDAGLARLIEPDVARRHRVLPVGRAGSRLTLAVDDPGDRGAIDAVAARTGCEVDVVITTAAAFGRAFARVYGEPLEVTAPPATDGALDAALARQAETARELAAVRVAHERIRQDLEVSARVLQTLERRAAEIAATLAQLTGSPRPR